MGHICKSGLVMGHISMSGLERKAEQGGSWHTRGVGVRWGHAHHRLHAMHWYRLH